MPISADRTNGRTYATVRPSVWLTVCILSDVCIAATRCVLEQKNTFDTYSKSYEESIGTIMKDYDLDLCI